MCAIISGLFAKILPQSKFTFQVVGRIAALTAQVSSGPSPIAKEINHFIHVITFVALGVGVTFFVLAIIYGYTLIHVCSRTPIG